MSLTCFSDADWAGNPDDRRFTSGQCVFLENNLIFWNAKKQTTVAKSSTESKYRSLAYSVVEISWVVYLLLDLHLSIVHILVIWCDNIGAISLASNPVLRARAKHIEVDYHYVKKTGVALGAPSPFYLYH